MKTIENKYMKSLSLILCTAITLHLGLCSTDIQVTAAGTVDYTEGSSGYRVELTDDTFHLYSTGTNSYRFTWGEDNEVALDNVIEDITMSGTATLYVESDLKTTIILGGDTVIVQPDVTLECDLMEGGKITNNGTFKRDVLSLSGGSDDDNPLLFINNGTLEVGTLGLYDSASIRSSDSSVFRISNSFSKGNFDLAGEVIASSADTSISSDGGSFTLVYNGIERTIDGAVNGVAGDLVNEDTSVSLSSMPDSAKKVYVGQDYDFSQYIRVTPSTYDGDPYIQYNVTEPADSTDYADTKHTAPGSYRARAVAPQVPGFRASRSEPIDYTIEYLGIDKVGDEPYTLKGIKNEFYVADKLTLVPADGFKVSSGDSYKDKIEFGKSDLFDDAGNARDIELSYKRTSDDAETDSYRWNKDDYKDLIFDEYDPGIFGEMADGVETSIEDGDVVVADSLSFEVYDDNLDKVIIDGKTYTGSDFEEGSLEVTLTSVVASPKDISVYAIDKAGRELELSFTLRHTPVDPDEAVVKVKDTYVGDDYEPKVTTDSDGEVSFIYRDLNGDPEDYFETKPTAAGKYEVIAYIAATDNYNEIECSDTFTISKRIPTAKVTVPDTHVGEDYEPKITTDSDGRIELYYSSKDPSADSLDMSKPSAVGNYVLTVRITATDKYEEATCSAVFAISKIKPEISISVPDTTVGEDYKPTFKTDSDAKDKVVIDYRPANDPDAPFTTTKPTAKGTYRVRATIPETATYLGARATSEFTISVKEATASVEVDDPYVGTKYAPVLTTNSDGKADAKFEYRERSAPDSDYSKDKPTAAGTYVVRATVPETATYGKAVCTNEFTISYLPAPEDPYTMKGTNGTNGYFTSDVDLIPADGYEISVTFGEDYSDSVPYSDDLNVVYLRRTKDGALTSAVAVDTRPKIDKDSPAISDDAGSLIDGSVHYGKDYKLRIDDPNLASLSVNGKPVEDAGDGTELTLDPGNYMRTFLLEAVDEAGNKTLIQITVKADWMKDMILPPDLLLPLIKEEMYKLGDGKWKVTLTNGTSDDPTVYNGNTPVYVMADGDYIFSTVN